MEEVNEGKRVMISARNPSAAKNQVFNGQAGLENQDSRAGLSRGANTCSTDIEKCFCFMVIM